VKIPNKMQKDIKMLLSLC